MSVAINIAMVGLWGGLLALERRAFLQAMFSRPLVAATGAGMLLDQLTAGLFLGMVLELFFLGAANLGAALPDNDTLAATCSGAACAAMVQSGAPAVPSTFAVALLIFIGMGRVGRGVDRVLERHSSRLVAQALVTAQTGDVSLAVKQNLRGMWPHFFAFGVLTAVAAGLGFALGDLVEQLPPRPARALSFVFWATAAASAGIAVSGSHARRAGVYAGAAALVAAGVLLWLGAKR